MGNAVQLAEEAYAPPVIPFAPNPPPSSPSLIPGEDKYDEIAHYWRKWFLIQFRQPGKGDNGNRKGFVFLNHGAFGAPHRSLFEEANLWRAYTEAQPLQFIDRELFPNLVHSLRRLAGFLRCTPKQLAIIPNVTTGLNAIIMSLPLSSDDCIMSLSIEYGSTKKVRSSLFHTSFGKFDTSQIIQEATRRANAKWLQIDVTLPSLHERIAVESTGVLY